MHEHAHGRERPRSHGPMQRRHARAIQGVRIRANRDEVLDRLRLRERIPSVRVSRVVERLRSSAIPRAAICPMGYQQCRDRPPKCSRGHVEGRVARVEVVSDVGKEEGRALLACRTHGR